MLRLDTNLSALPYIVFVFICGSRPWLVSRGEGGDVAAGNRGCGFASGALSSVERGSSGRRASRGLWSRARSFCWYRAGALSMSPTAGAVAGHRLLRVRARTSCRSRPGGSAVATALPESRQRAVVGNDHVALLVGERPDQLSRCRGNRPMRFRRRSSGCPSPTRARMRLSSANLRSSCPPVGVEVAEDLGHVGNNVLHQPQVVRAQRLLGAATSSR